MGAAVLAAPIALATPAAAAPAFTTFESGQVRPLALSRDGRLLFAVNTPDARLGIDLAPRVGGVVGETHDGVFDDRTVVDRHHPCGSHDLGLATAGGVKLDDVRR